MTLERAFRISSILLAASGFTGLALAGEVPPTLLALGCAAIGASLLQAMGPGERWLIFRLSGGLWNTLVILALIVFIVDFLWLSAGMLQAGIHFLVVLMVTKLLTLRERKDFLHLYALSLLSLLAAAALTIEIWYASVFVGYLLVAIWTLLLFHLRSEEEEGRALAASGPRSARVGTAAGPISRAFFWTTNGMALGALCLTVLIFFLTPRVGAGFFQKQQMDLIRTTGFSEKVDLGVIGAMKQDQTVVMRVEFPGQAGPPSDRLYFRGAAYDFYDGASWTNSLTRRRTVGRGDGIFKVGERTLAGVAPAALRQEVLIEALDTPTLFGVPFVQWLEGNFLVVQVDGMGALSLMQPPATRLQYTAYSTAPQLLPAERSAGSLVYPASIAARYLRLPPGMERVRGLAEQVTRQAGTSYERVAATERHLRGNYRYSLDVGAGGRTGPPLNPVEEFLFVRKTGYCEHYATAMVLMLRTLGIPARLVTGFLQGEWNDFGNYYTVRQRDAHAWVEVYFPQSGWITFDPTPVGGAAVATPVWTQAVRLVDSMRLRWDRFVIRYSLRDQALVVQGIRERGERVRAQVSAFLAAAGQWAVGTRERVVGLIGLGAAVVVLGAGLAAGAAVFVWLMWRRRRGDRAGLPLRSARQIAAVRLYSRMLGLLEAQGLPKAPGATPLEFARHVSRQSKPTGRLVQPLTDLYCRVRFGREALTAQDQSRAERLLERLRAASREPDSSGVGGTA
jgi:transglutaminase-like putative cysteine protease